MRNVVQIRSIPQFQSADDLIERELTLDESTGTIYLRNGTKLYKYYQSNNIETFISQYFNPKVVWRGTSLGIQMTPNQEIEFVDLKGDKGDKGDDSLTKMESYIKESQISLDNYLKSALRVWEDKYANSNKALQEFSKVFNTISIRSISNGFQLLDSSRKIILEVRDGKIYADGFIKNRK